MEVNIAFLFYENMTALDAIGPHEILCRLPGATIRRVAKKAGEIKTDSELILKAEFSISEVSQVDILVIPGSGSARSLKNEPKILDWIQQIHQNSTWTTSVCTGSLILGAAGLLKGRKATSHWATLDRLVNYGAKPIQSRIVESGKIMTAAEVSAGIDMGLILAAKISGESVAKSLQLGIEYDPDPPFNCGSPEKAGAELVENLRSKMLAGFEK